MNSIYHYMNSYEIPNTLSGYDHLAHVILNVRKKRCSIPDAIKYEATSTGLTCNKIRGRINYALKFSQSSHKALNEFVRIAARTIK